jgi:hypothetical protein
MAGAHPEYQIDDVLQGNVVVVGPMKAAPAHMQSDLLFRNVAQPAPTLNVGVIKGVRIGLVLEAAGSLLKQS